MTEIINKLTAAHAKLIDVEFTGKGDNLVKFSTGLVQLTQAINELIAKAEESEVKDGQDVLESDSDKSN